MASELFEHRIWIVVTDIDLTGDDHHRSALGGPAEMLWRDGIQLDFYSEAAQVDPAVADAAAHFQASLGEARQT